MSEIQEGIARLIEDSQALLERGMKASREHDHVAAHAFATSALVCSVGSIILRHIADLQEHPAPTGEASPPKQRTS